MESAYKDKFYENYKREILPQMIELEGERKSLLSEQDGEKKYKKLLKSMFLNKILNCIDFIKKSTEYANFWTNYSNLKGVSINNDTKVDDMFCGNYNDVVFNIIEVKNALVSNIHKNCFEGSFNGVILRINFNKSFNSEVIILPRGKKYENIISALKIFAVSLLLLFISIVSILFSTDIERFFIPLTILPIVVLLIYAGFSTIFYKPLNEVKLEDVEFTKKYIVSTNNQIEARYILTTAFIERFNKLASVFESKNSRVYFYDNHVYFAFVTDKDLFEIGDINIPTTDIRQIDKFWEEITAIADIIDHFKLNEKTGL